MAKINGKCSENTGKLYLIWMKKDQERILRESLGLKDHYYYFKKKKPTSGVAREKAQRIKCLLCKFRLHLPTNIR